MKRLLFTVAILAGFALSGVYAGKGHKGHILVVPDEMTWKPGPASIPEGAEYAVIEGNPKEKGLFTMRLRVPVNYKIMPHHHPAVEHVTVISGTFYMGMGEKFNEKKGKKLTPGGFATMEIGSRHFAFTKNEPAVVQLHGIGPWGITYVNPKDDPRKQTRK